MKVAIVQSNYIPWKGYFDMIAAVDEFILYDDVQYTRRDWRNRNRIKTSQGLQWLTVPVKVKGRYLQAIREHYKSLQRDLWVLDITSDLGISVFACVSRRIDRPVEDILLGFGAHFDPKIAILRAITEVNQFLPAIRLTNPDGSTRKTSASGRFFCAASKTACIFARAFSRQFRYVRPKA